jgi:hypothetical protein
MAISTGLLLSLGNLIKSSKNSPRAAVTIPWANVICIVEAYALITIIEKDQYFVHGYK